MAIKNRPTLIQQFSDFINRVSPFDGNPLIQKVEHEQVENDLFDSVLLKELSAQAINSPTELINTDFALFDSYQINSSASIGNEFTITASNISEGQSGKISITKKTNDTYSFSNANIVGISNISQSGTSIDFVVINVNGSLHAIIGSSINKSDATTSSNTDQLATSKAVNNLRVSVNSSISNTNDNIDAVEASLESSKLDKSRYDIEASTPDLRTKVIEIGDWDMNTTSSVTVVHGVSLSRIRTVDVIIIANNNARYPLSVFINSSIAGGVNSVGSTTIRLARLDGGWFDATGFNGINFNRGHVTITYTA